MLLFLAREICFKMLMKWFITPSQWCYVTSSDVNHDVAYWCYITSSDVKHMLFFQKPPLVDDKEKKINFFEK